MLVYYWCYVYQKQHNYELQYTTRLATNHFGAEGMSTKQLADVQQFTVLCFSQQTLFNSNHTLNEVISGTEGAKRSQNMLSIRVKHCNHLNDEAWA